MQKGGESIQIRGLREGIQWGILVNEGKDVGPLDSIKRAWWYVPELDKC